MKTNDYLYGKDAQVPDIPAEIIVRRIELLEEHLEELYATTDYMTRDISRIRLVLEAIKFWSEINEN